MGGEPRGVAGRASMKLLVDTTVWIDFFIDRPVPHVTILQRSIENGDNLHICGVILAETLQGIRVDRDYYKTKEYFESLIFLPMKRSTFIHSAALYRSLRKKGITIRKPVDCMIAAVAIENGLPLLHNDRDFNQIAQHSELKIVNEKETTEPSFDVPKA